MQESKSMVARLLANENITVQQGNYPTAWFDVEKRVLGIPVLNDEYGKDTQDLFIGHEVGHALETPAEGWHQSSVEFEVPRSFLNVCEDIRIERKVQHKYPGLRACFKRGYKRLYTENFFKTNGRDVNSYSLIDRLNLKSKLRDLIEIEFSAEELPYIKDAFAAETWDEVVLAAKAIYEFMKESQNKPNHEDNDAEQSFEEHDEGEEADVPSYDSSENGESSDNESDDQDGESSEEKSDNESDDQDGESSEESEFQEESNEQSEEAIANESQIGGNELECETDQAFRENENKLVIQPKNDFGKITHARKIKKSLIKDIVISYDEVKNSRKVALEKLIDRNMISDVHYLNLSIKKFNEEYPAFKAETKRFVTVLAKEFEMRKAAFRSIRAKESRTGSLNVNKLYSYKYNDDIFKKITTLADGKSHGMIMFVDYSGSMSEILPDVIRQTLVLVEFCKKVNIPFTVYGFTNNNYGCTRMNINGINEKINEGDLSINKLCIFELISSSMKKAVYKDAFEGLFKNSIKDTFQIQQSSCESLGSTPLIETLFVAEHLVADFKKKHNVQKMNLIMLTDGSPSTWYVKGQEDTFWYRNTFTGEINGKVIKSDSEGTDQSFYKQVLQSFRDVGVQVTGFFLAKNRACVRNLMYAEGEGGDMMWNKIDKTWKEVSKNNLCVLDSFLGHDRMFVLKARNKTLSVDIDNLKIDENASKAQVIRAFKKFSSSKKTNRVLASKFAEIVS